MVADKDVFEIMSISGGPQEKKLSDVVRERRATPAFSSDAVDDEDLKKILRAGLEAPSSYNLQPWRFVVVRDPEQRKRLRVVAMKQEQVQQAPVVVVACYYDLPAKADAPNWSDKITAASLQPYFLYNAIVHASLVAPTPLLIIHGTKDTALLPEYAQQAYDAAIGPKELI